ncbi:hypothetical protein [Paenibacillus durus]|uniref:hypothetical protein n=1 Tax=Paenibacillus durus TaxID=44251 RepID=UPI0004AD8C32|nr:hypothetical protein [Paenibacillus durus]
MLKIEKITDKTEELDVNGQGCGNDCVRYYGYGSLTAGCTAVIDAYLTPAW